MPVLSHTSHAIMTEPVMMNVNSITSLAVAQAMYHLSVTILLRLCVFLVNFIKVMCFFG